MTHDPKLLDYLEALPTIVWSGTVFRYVPDGRQPEKENTHGARWNPTSVGAIYTTLELETARAELAFHLSALSPRPSRAVFTVYTVTVVVKDVVDLRGESVRSAVGLSQAALQADDQALCRSIGGACHWLKIGGLLVPSARRPGGSNLVIFGSNQTDDFEFQLVVSEPLLP
jgi:RES domain-containing protein